MKQCLRIILVASLAFAVSTADAQTKLKPDGKALRTNTISAVSYTHLTLPTTERV